MKTWKQERAILADKLGMGDDWTCTEIMQSDGHVIGYWVDAEDKAHNPRSKAIAAIPDLLERLQEAENCLRWAAQEAKGRVKAEIVGGWLHHAEQSKKAIAKAKG